MSEISETEIYSMTKEQNYMRGYRDGKSDVLDKIRAEIDQKQYDFMADGDYSEGIRFGLMLAYQLIDKYEASPTGAEGSEEE